MAVMLRVVSGGILGIGAALFFLSLFIGRAFYWSDGSGGGSSNPMVWLVPFCYLFFCFLTSWSVVRTRSLSALGLVVHVGNLLYAIRVLDRGQYVILSLFLAATWFRMWQKLKPEEASEN